MVSFRRTAKESSYGKDLTVSIDTVSVALVCGSWAASTQDLLLFIFRLNVHLTIDSQ